ncbi:MAG TPA: nitroreductase family protein [Myxococcota bacterium]|nr:nitroreductase family protein [Myxococcota bacterium]HRY94398.1 nitroreductase family protein [Myxococcota bacterium]HSA22644.1 nitroreductase family protein [Myxococcota bacterium]
MDALELFARRYSCRAFKADPVASDSLMRLVDAARLAPSARAEQPWEFVVVTDPRLMKELGRLVDTGRFLSQAAACVVVLCRRAADYALEDGAAATENILLCATALGLGACWIAGARKAYAPAVERALKAPAALTLISLVAVGVPKAPAAPERARRPLEEVLHWQGF